MKIQFCQRSISAASGGVQIEKLTVMGARVLKMHQNTSGEKKLFFAICKLNVALLHKFLFFFMPTVIYRSLLSAMLIATTAREKVQKVAVRFASQFTRQK